MVIFDSQSKPFEVGDQIELKTTSVFKFNYDWYEGNTNFPIENFIYTVSTIELIASIVNATLPTHTEPICSWCIRLEEIINKPEPGIDLSPYFLAHHFKKIEKKQTIEDFISKYW